MPLKKSFALILVLLLYLSCETEDVDCSTAVCAGPPVIGFEILLDGENVFLNETFTIEDVRLIGATTNDFEVFLSSFDSEEENSTLFLGLRSFRANDFEFAIGFGNDFTVDLLIETELSSSGGCCGGTPFLTAIQIDGEDQELADNFAFSFTVNLN